MGYTHYWQQKRDFTPDEMRHIGESVGLIIAAAVGRIYPYERYANGAMVPVEHALEICNGMAASGTSAEITAERIAFNGTDEGDMGHETFIFADQRSLPYEGADPDRLGWAFCKTARKPYDVVVTAVLTYLAADWGFEVSSDGDVPDWEAGVALAEEALARQFANPLIVEALTQ